jgi:uncharacterized protein (DUF362 family)
VIGRRARRPCAVRRGLLALPGVWATEGLARAAEGAAPPPRPPRYEVAGRALPARGLPGMPGPYPGRVVRARSPRVLDAAGERVDTAVLREMLARAMTALTGDRDPRDSWRRFFRPADVVGLKVNVVGRPHVVSSPELVLEIVRNLRELGVAPANIVLYDRFTSQLVEAGYDRVLPAGVQIVGAEDSRGSLLAYDPRVFVDASFFGEDDTRSNLMRLVTERLTRIINVPNVKDHGAAGVTGCLKNIAYGSFSNVARSHTSVDGTTHTRSFIGTLAAVEPLRSRTVLQIADGLRGVWHGGPFARTRRWMFYPRQLLVGTDPVAVDVVLRDLVEQRRRAEGVISVWDRDRRHLKAGASDGRPEANVNTFIREPAHIEHAATLGLGVAERHRLAIEEVEV